jgi:uncharacterized protein YxeA
MKKYLWIIAVIVVIIIGALVLSNTSPTPVGEKQTVKIETGAGDSVSPWGA